MELSPVTLSEVSVALVQYKLSGRITFYYGDEDSGKSYEPYGNLDVDIGSKTEYQGLQMWKLEQDSFDDGYTYHSDLDTIYFEELETFTDASQTTSVVQLHGSIKEADNNSDEVIGYFENMQYQPYELLSEHTERYYGDDEGWTDVTLLIERV